MGCRRASEELLDGTEAPRKRTDRGCDLSLPPLRIPRKLRLGSIPTPYLHCCNYAASLRRLRCRAVTAAFIVSRTALASLAGACSDRGEEYAQVGVAAFGSARHNCIASHWADVTIH